MSFMRAVGVIGAFLMARALIAYISGDRLIIDSVKETAGLGAFLFAAFVLAVVVTA